MPERLGYATGLASCALLKPNKPFEMDLFNIALSLSLCEIAARIQGKWPADWGLNAREHHALRITHARKRSAS